MDYYYDLFVKYHDEDEERQIGHRKLDHTELMVLLNTLLYERKRIVYGECKTRTEHYPDYIRVE